MSHHALSPSRARLRRVSAGAAAALTVSGLLVLTGCGSDSTSSAAADPSSQSSQGGRQGGAFGGNRTMGLIADISGKTLQVQATDTQTAVTWTSATTFTTQVSQPLTAVKVGSCVVAQSAETAASGSTAITASTIAVSAATNGTCPAGFGGTGQGGAGRPSGMPSGGPQGMPSGAPSGAAQRSRPVTGKVTAVSGSSYTVEETAGTGSSQTFTVNTTRTTKVTAEKSTTSKAITVGACATVTGKADTTGAVKATAIGLRPATNGTCTFGFGGRGNG